MLSGSVPFRVPGSPPLDSALAGPDRPMQKRLPDRDPEEARQAKGTTSRTRPDRASREQQRPYSSGGPSFARAWSAGTLLTAPQSQADMRWAQRFGATTQSRAIHVWERRAFRSEPITVRTRCSPATHLLSLPPASLNAYSPSPHTYKGSLLSSQTMRRSQNSHSALLRSGSRSALQLPADQTHDHLSRVKNYTDLSGRNSSRPGTPTPDWAPHFPWTAKRSSAMRPKPSPFVPRNVAYPSTPSGMTSSSSSSCGGSSGGSGGGSFGFLPHVSGASAVSTSRPGSSGRPTECRSTAASFHGTDLRPPAAHRSALVLHRQSQH